MQSNSDKELDEIQKWLEGSFAQFLQADPTLITLASPLQAANYAMTRLNALIEDKVKRAVTAYENKVQDFAIETYVHSKMSEWASSWGHLGDNQNRYVGEQGLGYQTAQREIEKLLPIWRKEAKAQLQDNQAKDGV